MKIAHLCYKVAFCFASRDIEKVFYLGLAPDDQRLTDKAKEVLSIHLKESEFPALSGLKAGDHIHVLISKVPKE